MESGEVEARAAVEVLQTPNLASAKPGFVDRLIHAAYASDEVDQFREVSRQTRWRKIALLNVMPPPARSSDHDS